MPPCINNRDYICRKGCTNRCPYMDNPMFNPMKCEYLLRISANNNPIIPMYPRD